MLIVSSRTVKANVEFIHYLIFTLIMLDSPSRFPVYCWRGDLIMKLKCTKKETGYMLDHILVMQYTPRNLKSHITSRPQSSFLYVECGRYKYTHDNGAFYINRNEIVYLPKGSHYTYEVLDKPAKCIQIEFDLKKITDGKPADLCFSETPVRVTHCLSDVKMLMKDLIGRFFDDDFMTMASLYKIIALSFEPKKYAYPIADTHIKKIQPAIDYINEHPSEKTSIPELAKICGISPSHLRRLFHQCLEMSPVQYKSSVLMEYACKLLKHGALNVSETADILHFSDIYSFSQTFKKYMGISPQNYVKQSE